MKIFICADIEGVTGVVSWSQCGGPRSQHYDYAFARAMMTHDVNAAIRGARAAGATEIVVKDSHNTGKNLLISELESGVELISGHGAGRDGMMQGIDGSFDAVFLVGFHAMAGAQQGVMEHTITGRVHRFWINGREAGEQLMAAYTAWHYGVPVALVTSDDKGCAEAKSWGGAIGIYETKFGLGRYVARLLHPDTTGPGIEAAAKHALENIGQLPRTVDESGFEIRLESHRTEEADAIHQMAGWEREDGYTMVYRDLPDWPAAHVAARRAMAMASMASQE